MPDASSWYARKLSGQPAAPSTYTPGPTNYPGTPAPPPYVPPMPQPTNPQVTADNINQVAGLWKGGQATKTETTRCPNCSGDHFFSLGNASGSRIATANGMASAAPRCADCGFTTRHGLQTGAQ